MTKKMTIAERIAQVQAEWLSSIIRNMNTKTEVSEDMGLMDAKIWAKLWLDAKPYGIVKLVAFSDQDSEKIARYAKAKYNEGYRQIEK